MLRQLKSVIVRKCLTNKAVAGSRNPLVRAKTSKMGSEQVLVDFFNLKIDVKKKKDNTSL